MRRANDILLSISLQLLGLFLFTRGFFLMRVELGVNSTCDDTLPRFPSLVVSSSSSFSSKSTFNNDSASPPSSCWTAPVYDRLVFVVIDALRYDFADPRYTLSSSSRNANFQGHMTRLANRLNTSRSRSRLYRFEADAPTVTMQRLKALTSGCLPTFVDVSSNFASSTISEDNFITQGHSLKKKMVFMGDDTWLSLFPSQLSSTRFSFPYPSFNVFDLHSVDNGVMEHLIPMTSSSSSSSSSSLSSSSSSLSSSSSSSTTLSNVSSDWDILIAHFLGVDHVGHRHGPSHPEMASKLKQMDDLLELVTTSLESQSLSLKKKTLMVVLGDHGMTSGGNHGGATEDEVGAALYVHSFGRDLFNPTDGYDPFSSMLTMEQIDIVPTISFAMGLPIPYSSLGLLAIDWLWWSERRDVVHQGMSETKEKTASSSIMNNVNLALSLTNGLYLNAHQVKRFLLAYASVASSLTTGSGYSEFQSILAKFEEAEFLINKTHTLAARLASRLLSTEAISSSGGNEDLDGFKGAKSEMNTDDSNLRGGRNSEDKVNAEIEFIKLVERAYAQLDVYFSETRVDHDGQSAELLDLLSAHNRAQNSLKEFVRAAAALCRRLWTQFDIVSMCAGIFILLVATVMTIYYGLSLDRFINKEEDGGKFKKEGVTKENDTNESLNSEQQHSSTLIVDPAMTATLKSMTAMTTMNPRRRNTGIYTSSSSTSSSSSSTLAKTSNNSLLPAHTDMKSFSLSSLIALCVVILRLWALFTDTFIEAEERVVEVLYAVTVFACALKSQKVETFVIALISIACARGVSMYGGKGLTVEASSQSGVSLLYTLLPLSLLGFAAITYMVTLTSNKGKARMKEDSNSIFLLTRQQLIVGIVIVCLHQISCLSMYIYWDAQASGTLTHTFRLLLPRTVFALGLLSFSMNVYMNRSFPPQELDDDNGDITASKKNKLLTSNHFYFSSFFLLCLLTISYIPSLCILLGPWSPLTILFLSFQTITAAHLISTLNVVDPPPHTIINQQHRNPMITTQAAASIIKEAIRILLTEDVLIPVLIIHLLSVFSFHATGHAPKFSYIAFAAPFVGVEATSDGKVNFLLAGVMVMYNTFGASHGIVAFLFSSSHLSYSATQQLLVGKKSSYDKERFLLRVICPFLLASLCSCIFCLYARRELMVWAIFAPKFLFEMASLVLVDLVLLLATNLTP